MLDFEPGGVLLAMVEKENLKHKTGSKGTGKGTGKGKGTGGHRTCYKRGSEDHIAAACPVRTARVEAGAPERLDKPYDAMKGGKGGGKKGGKKGKDVWTGYSKNGYTFIPTTPPWKAATASPGVPFPSAKQ